MLLMQSIEYCGIQLSFLNVFTEVIYMASDILYYYVYYRCDSSCELGLFVGSMKDYFESIEEFKYLYCFP